MQIYLGEYIMPGSFIFIAEYWTQSSKKILFPLN